MMNTLELISQASTGDAIATHQILTMAAEHHWPRVSRTFGRSLPYSVTDDDLKQEFLIGFWQALRKVKLDIGNPLSFLVWKGRMKMIDSVKTRVIGSYEVKCEDCGAEGRFAWKRQPVCRKCGSADLDIWKKRVSVEHDDGEITVAWNDPSDPLLALEEHEFFMQVRDHLTGRSLELYDILIIEGTNRETSSNYLTEIAERWGCSTPNVARTLKRLQNQILEVYHAHGPNDLLEKFVLVA